jgi:hypothetical protein
MTLYTDEKAIVVHAAKTAKRKARKWYALSAAGVLLAGGGAAFAAMAVTGDGTVSADAYTQQPLGITNAHLSGPLYPSAKVDLVMNVKNGNPFKVKVTRIGVKQGSNPTVHCAGNDAQYLSGPLGTSATSVALPADDQVTIDGNGNTTEVRIHNAVQLSNSATAGCTLTVNFTLSGESAA